MELKPGARLGPYEIASRLGAGGMGEVWKASDSRLNREVAIKVSAQQFTDRFEREARAIAALNHSNICTLFDVGPNYLVMELIDGPTLADRIAQGPVPLDEALAIAGQIADALEAAHEKNIVHRDLKPGNIKIRPDGSVKVLDFGLAKAGGEHAAVSSDSPTMMHLATQVGVILGTAAYMAPEQARGKTVDRRADIWSFGVVLYEMVTGKKLFEGEDLTETLASVVMKEAELSPAPVELRRLLTKCLQKDPRKRLRWIGDWRELIEEERAASPAPVVAEQKRPVAWMAVCGVAILALAGLAAVHFREPRTIAAPAMNLSVELPDATGLVGFIALSPDGSTLAIGTVGGLLLRPLGSDQIRPLAGTELARAPFWSADGKNIAFTVTGQLKYVAASGGPAQQLCDGAGQGGTWNRNNVILIAGPKGQILKTSAAGGGCSPLPGDPAITRIYPYFLPDGKHFLYQSTPSGPDTAAAGKTGVYVASLDAPAAGKRLLPDDSSAIFAPGDGDSGYLLFRRDAALMGQAFDPATLQLSGEVFKIADGVALNLNTRMMAAAGPNGLLVYGTGRNTDTQLIWLDRAGKPLSPAGPVLNQFGVAISPGDRQIAISKRDQAGTVDIWLRDVATDSESRFTSAPLGGDTPVWSPDGKTVAFSAADGNLYRKNAPGGAKEELIAKSENRKTVSDWSRDGRFLFYTDSPGQANGDIWVLPDPAGKAGESKPYPFQQTGANESQAQLSPDGRWVAYTSGESGQAEVYVRPFPSGEGRWKVSVRGGIEPRWRDDGKELFYLERKPSGGNSLMRVPVSAGANGSFVAGTPVPLFERPGELWNVQYNRFSYAVAADGQRFVTLARPDAREIIHVVSNWTQGIGKKQQ
jgi:Tol biopolymer transport system component